jgi:hypothetical protein
MLRTRFALTIATRYILCTNIRIATFVSSYDTSRISSELALSVFRDSIQMLSRPRLRFSVPDKIHRAKKILRVSMIAQIILITAVTRLIRADLHLH